jgi:hypothetical protein
MSRRVSTSGVLNRLASFGPPPSIRNLQEDSKQTTDPETDVTDNGYDNDRGIGDMNNSYEDDTNSMNPNVCWLCYTYT